MCTMWISYIYNSTNTENALETVSAERMHVQPSVSPHGPLPPKKFCRVPSY